jgi:hypothetical protein
MSAPKRIQLRRTKGWRKPEGAVVVARPSIWGNPYAVGGFVVIHADRGEDAGLTCDLDGRLGITAEQAVAGYRDLMALRLALPPYDDDWSEEYHGLWTRRVQGLAGADLACWCPLDDSEGRPVPCHADVLLEVANR